MGSSDMLVVFGGDIAGLGLSVRSVLAAGCAAVAQTPAITITYSPFGFDRRTPASSSEIVPRSTDS